MILNLARELDISGCTNHIACIINQKNPHLELFEEARKTNLSALAIDCRGLLDLQTIKSIRAIIRSRTIDVIHCHDYKSCVFGLSAACGLRVKRVITNHLWTRSHPRLRIYHTLEGLLYNGFDKVVAVSEAIERECRPFILKRDKLTFIPNGIDLRRFALVDTEEERRSARAELGLRECDLAIGNIARLSVEKDQASLLRAFKILTASSRQASIKLLIAGDGPEEINLRKLAGELDIQDQCLFVGFRSDVARLLRCLDVYVQSSKREGLPMIILEAMASQAAIVSTRAGGIPKVITDGEEGRLVDIGDANQLARVLNEVLHDADERKRLGQHARRAVEEQFSARIMAERYFGVYRALTAH